MIAVALRTAGKAPGGVAGWVLARWRNRREAQPRLTVLERVTLGPRQTLTLVEADGRKLLVASSPEGGPAFYSLDGKGGAGKQRGRVSW